MLLFRRRPRDKEGPVDERPVAPKADAPTPSGPPPPPPAKTSPVSEPRRQRAASPPPLPRGPPEEGSAGGATETFPRCFVCGSRLEGGRCPVCKITWID